jgi:peptidoglycan/LPS O-acetylase OafA/YrhL
LPVQPLVPAWSLDVELQFYLVAPIMIMLAIRCGGLILLLCAAVMSLGFVYLIGSRGSPAFAVFFALGIAAAHTNWQPEPRLVTVSAMAAAAFVVGLAVSPWRGMLFGGANPDVLFHYTDVVNIAVALLVFPYAIFTTRQRGGIHDGFFADLSYIFYLLHWIAICWLRRQAHLPMSARLGCFVFAVAATFTCSWAIRTFYDRPLNRTRARWVSARLRETALGLGHVSRRSPFTVSCPLDTIPSRHKYFKRLKIPADSR